MGTSRSRSRQAEVLRTLSLQNRCFEASLTYRFTSNNFTFSAYHCQEFHIFSLSLPTISHFQPITANNFTFSAYHCHQFHILPPFTANSFTVSAYHCQQVHIFTLSLPTVSHFHTFTANNFTCRSLPTVTPSTQVKRRLKMLVWITHLFHVTSCDKLEFKQGRIQHPTNIVQELCESRGGRPGLSVLTSLLVSVDVKIYCTVLRHWSQLVPNMSHDI